jgi:hypothetical protein
MNCLKFAFDWETKTHITNGKRWKTEYKKALFEEQCECELTSIRATFSGKAATNRVRRLYNRFRKEHERIITSRNQLRKLYLIVRLLDNILLFIDVSAVWGRRVIRSDMDHARNQRNQTALSNIWDHA